MKYTTKQMKMLQTSMMQLHSKREITENSFVSQNFTEVVTHITLIGDDGDKQLTL